MCVEFPSQKPTRTHTHTHTFSLSHPLTHAYSLSLSLTHIHIHDIISIKKGETYPSHPLLLSFLHKIPLFLMEYNNSWLTVPHPFPFSFVWVWFFPAGARNEFSLKTLDGHTLTTTHLSLSHTLTHKNTHILTHNLSLQQTKYRRQEDEEEDMKAAKVFIVKFFYSLTTTPYKIPSSIDRRSVKNN